MAGKCALAISGQSKDQHQTDKQGQQHFSYPSHPFLHTLGTSCRNLTKKPILLSEEWALAVGQPRYPSSLGPEALRPTLSGGVPFSRLC